MFAVINIFSGSDSFPYRTLMLASLTKVKLLKILQSSACSSMAAITLFLPSFYNYFLEGAIALCKILV